jgi:hypothetical protein
MTEVWLAPNRRVLALASLPVGISGGLSAAILAGSAPTVVRVLAAGLLFVSLVLAVGLWLQWLRPRIAYRDGEVLFYLRARTPLAVPVEVIEAFFLGQGPAYLPGRSSKTETVNLVARLSQRAPKWAHQEVKPALGQWCDGYVTIRGTWCEPLTAEVIRRLNRRLREVSESKAIAEPSEASE